MRQEEDACKLLSANKISISHYNKHRLVYQRLDEFCKKNGINDMALDQFNRQTIHDLEIFFRTDCCLSVNSTAKMLEFIRKGILWAYQCGLILINPFATYRIKKEDTQVQFLNKQEILKIRKKIIDISRLDFVRDSFIFSCFTGISYANMCKLTKDQIVFDSKERDISISIEPKQTIRHSFLSYLNPEKFLINTSIIISQTESFICFPTRKPMLI